MLIFICKRLVYTIPIMLGVAVVCFMLVHLAPGDPLVSVLPPDASENLKQQLMTLYGFDRPYWEQFFKWLGRTLQGDLGTSIRTNRPVVLEVTKAVHNTLMLAALATVIGFVLGTLFGFALPALVASAWGDPLGGLLLGGFLRLLVQYHATFAINSVAHTIGQRPYSTETSARDSVLTALLTLGEGYHNYHHRFPGDYRNGILAHHFDPTKWWIWALSKTGLAWDLRRAPEEAIRKARDKVRRAPESQGVRAEPGL